MNKLFLYLVCIFLLLSSGVALSKDYGDVRAYLGTDIQLRHIDFHIGDGDNMLTHSLLGSNIYFGAKFFNFIGVEGGFGSDICDSRIRRVSTDTQIYRRGPPMNGNPVTINTRVKMGCPHLNLVYFYPFSENLELFSSIGVSYIKYRSVTEVLPHLNQNDYRKITFSGKKIIPRVSSGINFKITDNLKYRLSVGWIETGKLSISPNGDNDVFIPALRPKNTLFIGSGIMFEI